MVDSRSTEGTITAIDLPSRTVTVATPEGRARLSRVKPGDKLSLTVVSYVFGVVTRKQ